MSISGSGGADGGFSVPEILLREVERFERKFSPVRDLVNVVQISSGDVRFLLDVGGTAASWSSETGSRTATTTPTLREIVPTGGEIYSYPTTTEWLLDDAMFDIQGWLTMSIAKAFSVAEGQAVISGSGSNQPTGMLHGAPTAVSDKAGARAAAVYEYILGGDNSPAGPDGDALIDLLYKVNARYRANGTWAMNSTTAGAVRKLKASGTGDYIWQPSTIAGQPDRLLGYPVSIWEDLPPTVAICRLRLAISAGLTYLRIVFRCGSRSIHTRLQAA